jgi:hypothetical protein
VGVVRGRNRFVWEALECSDNKSLYLFLHLSNGNEQPVSGRLKEGFFFFFLKHQPWAKSLNQCTGLDMVTFIPRVPRGKLHLLEEELRSVKGVQNGSHQRLSSLKGLTECLGYYFLFLRCFYHSKPSIND